MDIWYLIIEKICITETRACQRSPKKAAYIYFTFTNLQLQFTPDDARPQGKKLDESKLTEVLSSTLLRR